MYNITFNETLFYDSKIPNLINQLGQQSEEILEVIEMPEIPRLSNDELVSDSDDEKELSAKRNQND